MNQTVRGRLQQTVSGALSGITQLTEEELAIAQFQHVDIICVSASKRVVLREVWPLLRRSKSELRRQKERERERETYMGRSSV